MLLLSCWPLGSSLKNFKINSEIKHKSLAITRLKTDLFVFELA